ncbi:helix-turn-helix transcriptional regulator [Clostridium perfringens]|uniref:helix-turn-helix domain-containing protein n=1 Tax=Clostridium perfringens TaxID=1502 RepID=UPI0013E40444|nr:helix-turn-helix transcriptional regulator [Clostridium perfringens]NGT67491.1 helix-turn-helix transcriptional regulator [Clostridium perfringens]
MLKELRLDKGIPLSFVACKLGVDRATLRNVENGKGSLRVEWIPILSELYGVSNNFIFKGYLKEREVLINDKNRNGFDKKIG